MLTFKRSLLITAALFTLFFLIHTSHRSSNASHNPSPKPTGSYEENRKILLAPINPAPPMTSPTSDSLDTTLSTQAIIDRTQRPQIPLSDLRSQPLRAQLAYQFPYDLRAKFPAYIWQTWKYTPSDAKFENKHRAPEASWTMNHPDFVHEVITDDVAVHLVSHLYSSIPEVVDAYQSLPVPVLKADFFRYLILLARGGIYSDIDTFNLKPAVDWVSSDVARDSYGMIVGIEADPDRPDWHEWYSRRIQFCQWTIQSKPGHPVLREIVANITEETLARKTAGTLDDSEFKSIVEYTGPAIWTDTIFDYFNNPDYFDMTNSKGNITWHDFAAMSKSKKVGDVVVLPITSFSPGVKQMGAGEDDDPMAFVRHIFEGNWKPEHEKHVGG